MAGEFALEIVTPDKKFFEGPTEMIVVRTTEGDVGIMKNHINYVAPLDVGVLKIKRQGTFKEAAIAGGFIQVDKEKTTVVTEAAEWADEIDIERAKTAKQKAETKLKAAKESDLAVVELKLKKAINRISVGEKKD